MEIQHGFPKLYHVGTQSHGSGYRRTSIQA
ncbi:hypothetical protein PIIN_11309 [Serendipita indica DSM 11827]|uniref:Uncharacterized protein n=1 Tax=Serendipita indica (strain DSM 11827) TaxID=1109443 RepID=G4U189_SERID|nr:hypothetical protein PIIN_11309 [Serendipita indica DSM 11827]